MPSNEQEYEAFVAMQMEAAEEAGPVHECEDFVSPCCGKEVIEEGFCAMCREACGPGECVECGKVRDA